MRTALLLVLALSAGCDALTDWCMATGWKSPEQCEAMRDL